MNRLSNSSVMGQQRTISRYGVTPMVNARVRLQSPLIRRPVGAINSNIRYSPYTSGNIIRRPIQSNGVYPVNRSTILIRRDATGFFI